MRRNISLDLLVYIIYSSDGKSVLASNLKKKLLSASTTTVGRITIDKRRLLHNPLFFIPLSFVSV